MDATNPPWSQSRFCAIESQVKDLLRSLQVNTANVMCVPVSGLGGGNLIARPTNSDSGSSSVDAWDWYSGPTLWEAIDSLHVAEQPTNGSLRAVVTDSPSQEELLHKRCEINVSVLRGKMRVGTTVGIPYQHNTGANQLKLTSGGDATEDLGCSKANSSMIAVITKLCNRSGGTVPFLAAGEVGIATVESSHDKNCANLGLRHWSVLYKGPQVIHATNAFRATILTTSSLPTPIIVGSTFELYLFGQEIECSISALISSRNASGTRQRPKCILVNSCGSVEVTVQSPICIEPFRAFKPFGRFAMRAKGVTCAIGTCDAVL